MTFRPEHDQHPEGGVNNDLRGNDLRGWPAIIIAIVLIGLGLTLSYAVWVLME